MAKNKAPVQKQKQYYYNEHDDNQVEKLATRQKKRRLKKKIKRFLVLVIIGLLIMFFFSPLSRVQTITVTGEHFLSESDVIDASGVQPDSVHALTYPYFIKKQLAKMPMVASCKVNRGFFQGIHIEIQERSVIAYELSGDQLRIIDDNGQVTQVDIRFLTEIQQLPRLINFSDIAIFDEFCKQLIAVPASVRSLMSDIVFDPVEPYDTQRVKINMSDGKIVYVRIEDMAGELKYYQEVLSREPDACIFDIYGNKVYASPCP